MSDIAVDIRQISRTYRISTGIVRRKRQVIPALQDISFTIAPGELFGLVGPNGAGKTTLIRILTTHLLPTAGQAYVLGYDVARQERRVREHINVVFGGDRGLYTRLSALDNLKYFADLYRVPPRVAAQRIPQLLELVDLQGREQERVEGYSRGMKQRLHIAKSLINDPAVLFLDEPTIGLDPSASRKLRTTITNIQAAGKTIILTSHYMYEVDALCRRIAVINKGRLITIDSPEGLKQHVSEQHIVEARLRPGTLEQSFVEQFSARHGLESMVLNTVDQFQLLTIRTGLPDLISVALRECLHAGDIHYIVAREPTLEDAYIKLIDLET